MRGKGKSTSRVDFPNGITPAYAGKRNLNRNAEKALKDHPRLCGEKFSIRSTKSNCPGSPPPMRGKAIALCSSPCGHRITPAYAGKSGFPTVTANTIQDHPRLCGEKYSQQPRLLSEIRITPAYAGKSLVVIGSIVSPRDHPRLCGEKNEIDYRRDQPYRITPAYAGKS